MLNHPRGSRCRSACESRRRVRNRCGIAASAAPLGRDSGRGQVVKWLSSNGRPVALLSRHPDPAHVRYCPSTRIPSPSHAAAAACLPTSGPPAFGTLRVVRSRTTLRTTTWCAATPRVFPGRRGLPRPRLPGRRWHAPVRALPRTWRTVPLRCVDRLCCAVAARHCLAPSGAITRRTLRPGKVACGDSDCGAP